VRQKMLEICDLSVFLGLRQVVRRVSLRLDGGQLVSMIGENGSGKSTLLDAICGFIPCTGQILLTGSDVRAEPSHCRFAAGLSRLFQRGGVFRTLTVAQNLSIATTPSPFRLRDALLCLNPLGPKLWDGIPNAVDYLRRSGILDRIHAPAGRLSHGQQRFLASLCLFSRVHSKVYLLDEPFAGLGDDLQALVVEMIEQALAAGSALLVVEHELCRLRSLVTWRVGLEGGRLRAV